jgi:hypothetical protein
MSRYAALFVIAALVAGCEKYDLGKDAAGNVVRLDRRTGEMAVVKNDQIFILKDAPKEVTSLASLEELKPWDSQDLERVGVRIWMSSLWRSGKMFYVISMQDLAHQKALDAWRNAPKESRGGVPRGDAQKRDAALKNAVASHRPFTFDLEDKYGFLIATFSVDRFTNMVDDSGFVGRVEEKNNIAISADDYRRIESLSIRWRTRQ